MTEMMSQEITRVMDQQSKLEKEYAKLVTLRSELKGLSNKHRLEDVRNDILVRKALISNLYFFAMAVSDFQNHSPKFLNK